MYITTLRRKVKFGRGAFYSWRKHFIIVPLYSLVLSAIAVSTSSKPRLHNRLLFIFYGLVIDLVLISKRSLKINSRYFLKNVLFHILMAFLSRSLYNLIYKRDY